MNIGDLTYYINCPRVYHSNCKLYKTRLVDTSQRIAQRHSCVYNYSEQLGVNESNKYSILPGSIVATINNIFMRFCIISCFIRDFRFGPKVAQIVPKWDKSGTFSYKITVQFGSASQNALKYDLKKSQISIQGQSDPF